jgi:hypothetical protein
VAQWLQRSLANIGVFGEREEIISSGLKRIMKRFISKRHTLERYSYDVA